MQAMQAVASRFASLAANTCMPYLLDWEESHVDWPDGGLPLAPDEFKMAGGALVDGRRYVVDGGVIDAALGEDRIKLLLSTGGDLDVFDRAVCLAVERRWGAFSRDELVFGSSGHYATRMFEVDMNPHQFAIVGATYPLPGNEVVGDVHFTAKPMRKPV